MTDGNKNGNLDEAMRLLLEQELTAGLGAPKPQRPDGLAAESKGDLAADVLRLAANALRMQEDQLDPTENLANFGVDSIAITEIMASISRFFGIAVAPTTFFEARHLNDLARILNERHAKAIEAYYAALAEKRQNAREKEPKTESDETASWLTRHRAKRPQRQPEHDKQETANAPIAIIAMEGMFAQSPDLAAFEAHLRNGDDCIEDAPPNRWDWREIYGDPRKGNFTQVKGGGFVPGHDLFDAAFFNISAREAELIDPQHRLFMQCVWSLIEKSGQAPSSLSGKKVGLFLGINLQDYANMANRLGLADAQRLTGLGHAFCPNRISFLLDIHGPSQVVDTACSSSLVALHRAALSIRHEGCEMAIAGGANLMLNADQHILFSKVGMLAPDGRCKSFSKQADGYGRADGIGAVLLKPLDKARQDGDPILGVILASAEQHGGGATSLTAPNPKSQAKLIVETHRQAGIDPRSVSFIECHGTGTPLGDPAEIEGLKAAFNQLYAERNLPLPSQPGCALGAVKSNIGHCETAAGIAGVIKTLLSMQNGVLYRSLYCDDPNPLIELDGSPFYLLSHAQAWARPVIDGVEMPRRAGISSFGAGGTNAHIVIEEYRPTAKAPAMPGVLPQIFPISAHCEESLRRTLTALVPFLEKSDFDDLAYSLQTGRDAMKWRVAFVAADADDLARQMQDFLKGERAGIAHGLVDRLKHISPISATEDAGKVAAAWAAGATVDWSVLHETGQRQRLTLPGTSFIGKRYWLSPEVPPVAAAGFVLMPAGIDCWQAELRSDAFYLKDHRLGDRPILPGVAYLELARIAAKLAGLDEAPLRNVVWIQPLAVSEPIRIEIALLRDDSAKPSLVEISSLAANAPKKLHAQIRLGIRAAAPPPTADLTALKAACPRKFDAQHIYAAFERMGLNYGPAHRAVAQLAVGRDRSGQWQVLAKLALPACVSSTLSDFVLHPSLMDGAFQAAIGMALGEGDAPGEAALPFAIDGVEIFAPCRSEIWVHIRQAGKAEAQAVQRLDLVMMDENGVALIALKGFTARLAKSERQENRPMAFLPVWRPVEAASPVADSGPGTLLLAGDAEDAARVKNLMTGWTCRSIGNMDAASLDATFLTLTQAVLAELQSPARQGPLWILLPEGGKADALAGIIGMLRTAAQERQGFEGGVAIIPPNASKEDIEALFKAAHPSKSLLRLKDGVARQEVWEPADFKDAPPPWENGKVYLVTGGLGGLGRLVAQDILRTAPEATVVLAARSAPKPSDLDWLNGWQGRIEYKQADLSDADAANDLIAFIQNKIGPLSGVIHAAGVIEDARLADKTPEQLARVLAAKVSSAVNLDQSLGDAPLDFFVLFSSMAGVLGSAGQADYAAANAFLDGFALWRQAKRQQKTVSVAWPFWKDGGMAMDEATQALMTGTTGLAPLETSGGLAALAFALAQDEPRVMIAAGDKDKVCRMVVGRAKPVPSPVKSVLQPSALKERLLAEMTAMAANQLKAPLEEMDPRTELTEYGFDSIGFTQFANSLNEALGLELTPTVFFEHQTLAELAKHLTKTYAEHLAERLGVVAPPSDQVEEVMAPLQTEPLRTAALATSETASVAIIGMSCHFPKAKDVREFWRNLEAGVDCISEIPPERWNWRDYWGDPLKQPGRCDVRWGGFIEGAGAFDTAFFGLSAPEARMMDPQQRLLLTQAWRVMEDAGYAPASLSGSSTGVFIGTADTGYGRLLAEAGASIEGYSMTGLAPSLGPNRISYHFNFHGPSVAVETACSSALVAIHRAVEAIRHGQCETAIAGGVNLLLLPDTFIGFAKAGMLAKDGRCKPFSADADGYARGEGLGLVFLKRLDAALQDGDRILAVIRASGENHGGHASSLTAPNPKAQASLLRTVYGQAGFDPRTVGYIEAHGTGTPLGDPIEIEALSAAFDGLSQDAQARYGTAPAQDCAIGSVKSNIGHLELAAGAAGLIKALLQIEHGKLVKTLHCEKLNPYLKLEGGPFHIVADNAPWPRATDAQGNALPRRAGISSFGFGGSNAHVVIEEFIAREEEPPAQSSAPQLFVLSAHSPEALTEWAGLLRDHIASNETAKLADLAFTLQTARDAMEHRLAFAAATAREVLARLDSFLSQRQDAALHQGRVKPNRAAMAVLENDPEFSNAAKGMLSRGNIDGLLELWVRGLEVDWKAMPGAARHRRTRLPPYPLATTEYWAKRAHQPEPAVPAAAIVLPEPPKRAVVETQVETDPVRLALEALTDIAARTLEVDPKILDADTELGEFGFDSITMTSFASKVNAELNLSLTPADFFEFATLSRLARHIAGSIERPAQRPQAAAAASVAVAETRMTPPVERDDDPIVITGFSCSFPGARDGNAFWRNLIEGRDCISEIPPDRWDWREFDGDPKIETGKTNIRWGGFIDGVFEFDPLFFGISPREAKLMDPQQRLVMTHVWKAIEDSGHAPRSLAGRKAGLFIGTSSSGYRDIIGDDTGAEGYVATGAVPSVGPNRISFFLDWHGPSEPVETACSSSLVALHRAIQAMRAGDCDMAVAGGVNTIVTPEAHINFAKAGMLSLDGRCKTFSAQANGYVRGEGVGVFVLKRQSEAERDGDPILAIVKGSAVGHGGRANSLTAPNTQAQADVLREAQARAGVDPATIGYIETHGTGTALGDPVEINALKAVFKGPALSEAQKAQGGGCGLASVKSNIGHLELAAGAAGVIKVLLQLKHRRLAPSLHCAEINPYIDLGGSPLRILREAQPWRPILNEDGTALPLRAGVSSFGFGGVNAHVLLEEYKDARPKTADRPGPCLMLLSARDGERLKDQARNLLSFIDENNVAEDALADLAYTLQIGRDAMRERLAFIASDLGELRRKLADFLSGGADGILTGRLAAGQKAGAKLDGALSLRELAEGWVKGGEVDWQGLHPHPRRRLRLPTYPFAKEIYHMKAAFAGSAQQARPTGDDPFAQRLSASDFFLRDHLVRGAAILPGAMGLELARQAFAKDKDQPFAPVVLSRVVWLRPLQISSGAVTATVPLTVSDGDAFDFRLLSEGPGSAPHMQGRIEALGETAADRINLEALRSRCAAALSSHWLYEGFARLGLNYGPSFQTVREIHAGKGEVLARLHLQATDDAAHRFGLHPSMLDGAFQAILGLFHDKSGNEAALPFALDRLEALSPTTGEMWAHVRTVASEAANGVLKLDIDLADDKGLVLARIRGFSLRLLKPEQSTVKAGTDILEYLASLVAKEAALPPEDVEAESPLESYGIDSVMIARLTDALERDFGPLPKTLFFEYRTLAALADYFASEHAPTLARLAGKAPETPPPPQIPASAPANAAKTIPSNAPIAIIGMSGRYPKASNLEEFWRNLEAGLDCISEIPPERWDGQAFYDPKPGQPGKTNGKWGGFIDGIDRFDPLFFNISPREAEYIDPQERLFLQCAWETLEDAGYTRANLAKPALGMEGGDVGVFVGLMYQEYQLYGAERTAHGQPMALNGSAASIANRVSYFCGFQGPSLTLDSMCSSSLTAIHLACQSLRNGECQVALAGGVNLSLHPNKYLGLAQGRFMSSNGRCESFGKGGDGYVPGEGVGAVLLKPLDQAVADGDRIWGVIRATALNHGGKTNGYTVPNPAAQTAVIGRALDLAGIGPDEIGYVEAHGTGTSLGDPIEIAALTRAFRERGKGQGKCAIGSVKSNIGHCESAAGMAGLAKVLLQFKHRKLVPSLHAETLNPGIDFAASPFAVQRGLSEWNVAPGQKRIAGLSSFGAGGANAHVILEAYETSQKPMPTARTPMLFPLSARDPERLMAVMRRLRLALDRLGEEDLPSVAFVLQEGREAFEERLAIVADGMAELKEKLDAALGRGGTALGIYRGRLLPSRNRTQPATDDLHSLAAAWVGGTVIDWPALRQGRPRPPRLALPTYPFAAERYWIPGSAVGEIHASPKPQAPLALLFAPHWKQRPLARECAIPPRHVVVLCEPQADEAERISRRMPGVETRTLQGGTAPIADRYRQHALDLLELLQGLIKERQSSALLQLAVPLQGEDALLEGLAGTLRTASLECPALRCQMIACDQSSFDLAGILKDESESLDRDIRYVAGQRRVRQWREVSAKPAPAPWKDGGVYLVTGGAGGIGLHLCQAIAASVANAKLWLTGRSMPSPETLDRFKRMSARIEYRQADVADGPATKELIGEIVACHGRLDGVVHAAGLTRDALLARKTWAEARDVLTPKVLGTVNLDRATAHLDLDFMLLFASASGALGNPGQADYAAANGFMDAFAAHRNKLAAKGLRRGRCLSLDWPYWQDGGMRMSNEAIAAMERLAGAHPLSTPAAMAALDAAMACEDEEQILVLAGDHDRLRKLVKTVPAPLEAPSAPPTAPSRELADFVTDCFAQVLKIAPERLTPDATLDRFGMDSVSALEIVAALEKRVGPLPQTLLFEFPTIGLLSAELAKNEAPSPQVEATASPSPQTSADDIAIIAVAGRFPGADTVEEFWKLLAEGRDCIGEVPADRWDPNYSPEKGRPGTSYCKWGGFLKDVDCFDADFFGYTPRMAQLADPQERLFLETVWRLLERAGHTRPMLRQRYDAKVGVFVGAMFHGYSAVEADAESRVALSLSSYASIANRASFFFDLQGPSVAIDSMCSSGLQAVHQACQSLRFKECRLAIAGGVNLSLLPGKYQGLSRFGLLGSRADSRAFADGDGYLPAEGVGAVLLKPLDSALRDGDTVLAVIKGSNANHAGHSAGFGVPSAEAQARLIEEDLRRSNIDARSISYVEAAASGSSLGDAIEIRALTRAFRAFTPDVGFCAIGSVKTNMGHAEAASGMAQLTKVLLQLWHARLVPTLKPARMNPALDFKDTPFYPQWQATEWRRPVVAGKELPRRACISSFGAGGSNVHLILEEAPPCDNLSAPTQDAKPRRFPVSARTQEQLQESLRRLADFVESDPSPDLVRLSRTLRLGREPMEHAVQIVAVDRHELIGKLRLAASKPDLFEQCEDADDPPVPPLVLPEYPFARQRHWVEAPPATGLTDGSDILTVILDSLARELGKPVDASQPFLAMGVDSMTALRLGYEINERLGLSLNLQELADHPTPNALAQFLRTGKKPAPPPSASTAPSRPASDGFPLSEGQQGLWVIQSLYPDQGTYNVPLAFRLNGIDHKALSQACRWLLQAYPILSARLLAHVQPPLLETKPAQAPLRRVKVPKGMDPLDFARRQAQRPFDLASEPLSRFELLHGKSLGDGHEILLMTVHHMVFDGASAWIAAKALWQAYERFASKQEALCGTQAADFADFVAWERAFMPSPRGQEQLAFWRERLAGELPVVDLPTERPARADGVIEGQSLERRMPPAFLAQAKETAAKLGITPASFFLGILYILLYRHTGQSDILVGVPSLRRPERRFENSVGYFVNMLALRQKVEGRVPAEELLMQTHKRMVEALSHGDYPFAAIVRGLGDSLGGKPPYQISYAYQNFLMASDAGLPAGHGQAQYLAEIRQQGDGPFGLEFYEDGDGLRLVAGYDGARFEETGIERLLDRFVLLAKSVCANPALAVGGFDLLSERERKRLGKRKAQPVQQDKRLLPDLVAARAKKQPKAVAVIAGEDEISYRRLVRLANRLARHLKARGVGKGDAVAVLLERNIDSIAALLAVMTAGAVWVPLDGEAPDQRLSAMLADCEAKALLTGGTFGERAKKIVPPKTILVDLLQEAQAIAQRPAKRLKTRLAAKDAAYVIYTSGSTGAPKGVAVSHRSLADHCRIIADHYALNESDAVLQFAPHVVDTALEQILPPLIMGARLVMRTGMAWPPHALLALLRSQRITVADLPPAYLRDALLSWKDEDFSLPLPLRLCVVGGEALPADTVRLWLEGPLKSARLVNAYGPTEATITCLAHEVREVPRNFGVPIGLPLPGTRILILDRDGNPVPEGVVGELHIGGNRLAIGYRNRPDLTQEKFVTLSWRGAKARFYRTGDLASFLPGQEGCVAFHGRADQQVKIRGFRVELDEIKAAMDSFGLRESAVASRPDGRGDQNLIAYVVPLSGDFDEEALRGHLTAQLPAHMLPTAIIRLDALPLTPSGKLDRHALPLRAEQGPSDDQPRHAGERELQRIWALVLDIDAAAIGIHEDFQRLGGHSLLWLRLLTEIGNAFRMRLSPGDFLAARTIAEQAAQLRRLLENGEDQTQMDEDGMERILVPLRSANANPASQAPLFLVHPVAGSVSCYVDLARRLDPGQPVYGLQIPGADDPSAPTVRLGLPKLAERYLAAIRKVQKSGPYRLGGWSMGGVLAYEMARQLRQDGQEVALLCLIESYAPDLLRKMVQTPDNLRRDFERDVLGPTEPSETLKAASEEEAQHIERLFLQYRANCEALAAYAPPACDVALTLIRAKEHRLDDETCGWGGLALGGVTSFAAPGTHYTILSGPGLETCANILDKGLAQCRNPA